MNMGITTARWLMECMPRMADWGGLMMGVDSRLPYTPPFEMVKVPPAISSMLMVPSLAFLPRPLMVCTTRPHQHPICTCQPTCTDSSTSFA